MTRSALILWPSRRKDVAAKSASDGHEFLDGLSYLERHGYRLRILDPFPFPANPFLHKGSLLAGLDVLRFLRLLFLYRKYDVLLSVGCSSAFFFAHFRRLFRLKKPIILIDPHLSEDYPTRQLLQKQLLPYVDAVIVFGSLQVAYLRKLFDRSVRAHFIPHRLDCAFFKSVKAPVGSGPQVHTRPYVLCIGNDPQRDFETLYKAVPECGATVLLHTSTPLPAHTPSNLIVSKGWLSFPELRALYDGASAVVLPLRPTIYAGGINSLLEAMAMEKAVIVSDSPGLRDYISHETTAWIVPPNDPIALRAAIQTLVSDKALASKLGLRARQFCERECDFPVYAGRLAQILDSVLPATVSPD